jgi:hypothetical protein
VKRIFTEYVRGLGLGEPPPADTFEELWEALRAALRSELSRRGLAHSSPSYLGIHGYEAWSEPAFEELLADCYSFIFLDRWRSLKAQLRIKPNVDGLVFLNIRHFLHERQERHDPLGYQVFRALHAEVTVAVERGELLVLGGGPQVRNETTLGFATAGPGGPPREVDASAVVRGWSEALAPAFVERRGQGARSERIREGLGELSRSGIERFRFRDLLDPLKIAARLRWAALLEQSQGRGVTGSEDVSALVAFDRLREDEESFRVLTAEVAAAIEALDVDGHRREQLRRLWHFVVTHASDPATDGEELPSFRKTGAQLQIPRETLPSLYGTLGRLVRERKGGRSRRNGRYLSGEAQ